MMPRFFLGPYLFTNNILLVVVFLSKVLCSQDGVFSQESLNIAHHYEELQTKHSMSCSYKNCDVGVEGALNVHLVPHTHDDVGWLKTVDQYYYGANQTIQDASVQYILDSVVSELLLDKNKRFIYVEIAFFARWWNEQSATLQKSVKDLVNEGRLEFILGGWCMEDEASTHYNAMIDQHTLGFQFLKDTFGDCGIPKVGWQIDPFGHSREQASMFAQFGFDGLFFGRLDYQDKLHREAERTMEMMWQGSDSLGDEASLFTGVNYNMYQAPPGFNFDSKNTDIPIMDDPRMHDYNVDERVDAFIKYCKEQASVYSTNHIMLTMGSDFQYSNAHQNYKNLDKLINYVNQRRASGSNVNVFYSTPSCYLYALNRANQTYSVKHDDFFPYADRAHSFWTGYFTSRPTLKGYVRSTNNLLQICQQLSVFSGLTSQKRVQHKIDVLRKAVGVAQHHDAVSGTEKQHVANDYAMRLQIGIEQCQDVIDGAFGVLLRRSPQAETPHQSFCQLLNISYCSETELLKQFTVQVYNPLAHNVSEWIRLPVMNNTYRVLDSNLDQINTQLLPISESTFRIPERPSSRATQQLLFKVTLPPLGSKTYFVTKLAGANPTKALVVEMGKSFIVENTMTLLTFSPQGHLSSHMSKLTGDVTNVSQSLMYYKSYHGNSSEADWQPSGAYVFRPNGSEPLHLPDPVNTIVRGDLVTEVHQNFTSWASQVIRLYKNSETVEIEYTIGPIPTSDGIGKEVISRFETSLQNNGTFYTDANGREMIMRKRDFRPTWDFNQTEPTSGNYYPVNSRIYIQDDAQDQQVTILTDRSQGGSSVHDGQLELMLHRRTLIDDGFGAGEALNETGSDHKGLIVRARHIIHVGRRSASHRPRALQLYMSPIVTFAPLTMDPKQYQTQYKIEWSAITESLPPNVHLLTLQSWRNSSLLIRLEHFYEKGEDPRFSQPANVSLNTIFHPFTIASLTELSLGANQRREDVHRLKWNTENFTTHSDSASFVNPVSDGNVELLPMQIRTFQIQLKPKTLYFKKQKL